MGGYGRGLVRPCYWSFAVTTMASGLLPEANGEPATGEMAPRAAIAKACLVGKITDLREVQLAQGTYTTMSQVESAERGANVRFPPPLVYIAFILLGVALRYAAPFPVPGPRFAAIAAGVAVLLAGLWLMADAWKLFARTGQHPAPWTPSPELVLAGSYRFTRNPMYLGMTCIQAGLGLELNNLWISALAAFSLLVVHFVAVVPEERYLSEKFGESYKGYFSKVRRYL